MSQKASLKAHCIYKLKPLALATGLTLALPSWADSLPEAQHSFDKGEFSTAVIELKNLLQDDPKNAEARMLLGRTYLKQMDVMAAIKELEKARQLGVPAKQWAIPLTRSYYHAGEADKTIAQLEHQASLDNAQQAELLAIVGHAQLTQNLIADAKETFQQATDAAENSYAKVGLARIAILEEDNKTADTLLKEAIALDPDNFDALITQSQLLSSQDQYQAAIEPLNHALSLNPKFQKARIFRSELYIRTNQLELARDDANTLLKQNPHNGMAHLMLARLLLNDNQYKDAQTAGEKALRSMPENLMTHFILGASHYAQQNFEQAQFYLEKFISAQPNHLIATRLMGATYLQLKDANSAVELLSDFVDRTDTKDAHLLNLLGRAYLQVGDYDLGTEMLNQALEIDPNIENTRTQLAIGQIASGDISSAVTELENAVNLPDATERTSIMLILSYLNQKQYEKAFSAINRASKQYPTNAIFPNLKGMAYEYQENSNAAKQAYNEALEIDNQFIPSLIALAKLEARNNQLDTAEEHLNKALKIDNAHMQALLLMANLATADKNNTLRVKWLEKARDRNPTAYQPVNMLVDYYLEVANVEKAHSEASRFYTEQGSNTGSLSLMARVSIATNEPEKALSYLQNIVSDNSQDVIHRLQLAQLLINDKQYDSALKYINETLEIQPNNANALLAQASVLITLARFNEAQETLKIVEENYPDSALRHRLKGDILNAQGNKSQAIAAYEAAFDLSKTPYLTSQLAQLYKQSNNQELAFQTLESYLQAAPTNLNSRLTLASMYQQAGKNKQAISHYETVINSTDNIMALNNLAWLYWLENSNKALSTAKKAHLLAPEAAAVTDTYGWIMLHMGNKSEGLKLIREAISKSPANPDIRYHLAKGLAMTGDKTQAKKEVDRLLRDHSGFEEETAAKALAAELE